MEFKHLDQESREIRLIRIDCTAASSEWPTETPLHLHLEHKSRDETEYAALSYVWGDGSSLLEVTINGAAVPVFHNLWEALCKLRRQRITSWLWIDAICINQRDNVEKSWLVNDMRGIFEEAQTVYHWLGPAHGDSDFAMHQLAQLGRNAFESEILEFTALPWKDQEKEYGLLLPSKVTRPILRDWLVKSPTTKAAKQTASDSIIRAATFLVHLVVDLCGPTDLDSERMSIALEKLLLREFWSRLWIIQELGVARNGVLVCGDRLLPVDHFECAMRVDKTHIFGLLRRQLGAHPVLWSINRNLLELNGLKVRKRRRKGKALPLKSILLSGMGSAGRPQYAASDPRDIIFGLLGVISDVNELSIQVDYKTSAVDVFTITMRAFLRQKDGMKILGYNDSQKDLGNLPSWVPDWSRIGRKGLKPWPVTYSRKFNASLGNCQPERIWAEQRSLGILSLAGISLSKVASVQPVIAPQRGQVQLPIGQYFITEALRYCDDNGIRDMSCIIRTCFRDEIPMNGYTKVNSVFICLAEKVFRGKTSIDEWECSPEETDFLLQQRSQYAMDGLGGQKPSTQATFKSFARSLQQHVWLWLGRLRLFVTDDGRLGLGRPQSAVGDLTTIIYGYEAPIVIRPIGDESFKFVGDAYVDGVMYGEVIEERAGDTDVFDIV